MNFELFLSMYADDRVKARYSCLHRKNYCGDKPQFFQDIEKKVYETDVLNYELQEASIKVSLIKDANRCIYSFLRNNVTSRVIEYIAYPPKIIIDGHIIYNGAKIRMKSGNNRICIIHKGDVVTGYE